MGEFVNTRVPGNQALFDTRHSSKGAGSLDYKGLLVGQGTDAGTATVDTLTIISSGVDAAGKFGEGSMLHRMAKRFFKNSNAVELWAIAASLDPVSVSTNKSIGEIKFTSAATANGVIAVYIAGERISLSVTSGDSVADLADNLAVAIAAQVTDLPVKSTSDTIDTVDFEALNVGTLGDDIDISINVGEGEVLPDGVAYTITAMNAGASDPAITSLIAALGDKWFQVIAFPYTDATNMAEMQTEMERRFGPTTQIDGVCFGAKKATYANLITFGLLYNTEQFCYTGVYGMMMTPHEYAAAKAGAVANHLQAGNGNESKPFQSIEIIGADAPSEANVFSFDENSALLKNGIATFGVDAGGKVRIQRLITMYRLNASSVPDTAWLDVNTRYTALFIRWDWVRIISLKYSQAKLSGDGNRIGPGQVVMTPSVGKGEAVAAFLAWEVLGLVEDFEAFKSNVIASRDLTDVNKFNWQLFPDLVNQFRNSNTTFNIIL